MQGHAAFWSRLPLVCVAFMVTPFDLVNGGAHLSFVAGQPNSSSSVANAPVSVRNA
jgi:hypothetical protein